jgi:hypothetical protein
MPPDMIDPLHRLADGRHMPSRHIPAG